MGPYVCPCVCWFSRKIMFSTNGMCVRLLLINDIIVIIRLVLFEDLGNVNL